MKRSFSFKTLLDKYSRILALADINLLFNHLRNYHALIDNWVTQSFLPDPGRYRQEQNGVI